MAEARAVRVLAFVSAKGGVSKSMASALIAMAIARRGYRCGLLDLSMIAPNQEGRNGVLAEGVSVPTLDELPPVSAWWQERTSGFRLLSAPRSMAARSASAMAGWLGGVLGMVDGSLDVLVLDLDGVSNNELHRAALAAADEVVFVLDHSRLTLDAVQRAVDEIQSPHPEVRNGIPQVPIERCRFMFSDRSGAGGWEQTRLALAGRGRWCGHLSYSAKLDAVGELGRLALACPPKSAQEADQIVSRLLDLAVQSDASTSGLLRSTRKLRRGAGAASELESAEVDPHGRLRVFGGPLAPEAMTLVEFRVLAALAGWHMSTPDSIAAALGMSSKSMTKVIKAMTSAGLVEIDHGLVCPKQSTSDVSDAALLTRSVAKGTAEPKAVERLLAGLTHPAYGGGVGEWAFTKSAVRGLPLLQRAEETVIGLADQLALRPERYGALAGSLSEALDRCGLVEPGWRRRIDTALRSAQVSAEPARPCANAWPPPPPPIVEASSAAAFEVVVSEVEVSPVAAPTIVTDRTGSLPRRGNQPAVLLRLFGSVDVDGAAVPQALSVPLLLGVAMRAMPQAEVCEITGYSASAVQNVFKATHPVVGRDRGMLYLNDGVWTEHEWLAELVRAAAAAVQSDHLAGAVEKLQQAFEFSERFGGAPFERLPRPKLKPGRREARDVWAWVDEAMPGGWLSPREVVSQRYAESLLLATNMWCDLGRHGYPAETLVDLLCTAARRAPHAAVTALAIDGWNSGAEVLLLAAWRVAGSSKPMRCRVQAAASQLVADKVLDPDDRLADALRMARE